MNEELILSLTEDIKKLKERLNKLETKKNIVKKTASKALYLTVPAALYSCFSAKKEKD